MPETTLEEPVMKRGRGRPPLADGVGRDAHFHVRCKEDMKELMQAVRARLVESDADLLHRLVVEEAVRHGIPIPETLKQWEGGKKKDKA